MSVPDKLKQGRESYRQRAWGDELGGQLIRNQQVGGFRPPRQQQIS
jgi:hypothetical protein